MSWAYASRVYTAHKGGFFLYSNPLVIPKKDYPKVQEILIDKMSHCMISEGREAGEIAPSLFSGGEYFA